MTTAERWLFIEKLKNVFGRRYTFVAENHELLSRLDERLLNAPTSFHLPPGMDYESSKGSVASESSTSGREG